MDMDKAPRVDIVAKYNISDKRVLRMWFMKHLNNLVYSGVKNARRTVMRDLRTRGYHKNEDEVGELEHLHRKKLQVETISLRKVIYSVKLLKNEEM